jgi:hypothetical protein
MACLAADAAAADAFIYDYCLKLSPGKGQAFRELQSTVEPKLAQVLIDRGEITSWTLLRSVVPTGTEARCDGHVLYEFPGFPTQRTITVTDEDFQKAKVKLSRAEWQQARNSTATIVNLDVWRIAASVGARIGKGSFVFFNPDKADPLAEWVKLETTGWQPFAEARAKETAGFGWRALVLALPRGSGVRYNAATMDVYPDWGSLAGTMSGERPPAQSDRRDSLWSKAHPDFTRADYLAAVNRVVDRYRVDLFEAMEAVHKK